MHGAAMLTGVCKHNHLLKVHVLHPSIGLHLLAPPIGARHTNQQSFCAQTVTMAAVEIAYHVTSEVSQYISIRKKVYRYTPADIPNYFCCQQTNTIPSKVI